MLSFTDPAVTPTEAQAYIAAGGAAGWPDDATAQAQALMRGQRYVAARFNSRWREPFDADTVPEAVKLAIIEAAIVEARKPGALSPMSTPATDKVLVGAKGLQWERVAGAGGADAYVPRIAAVEGLLAPLTRSGNVSFLSRA